jgi:hypothetical protein
MQNKGSCAHHERKCDFRCHLLFRLAPQSRGSNSITKGSSYLAFKLHHSTNNHINPPNTHSYTTLATPTSHLHSQCQHTTSHASRANSPAAHSPSPSATAAPPSKPALPHPASPKKTKNSSSVSKSKAPAPSASPSIPQPANPTSKCALTNLPTQLPHRHRHRRRCRHRAACKSTSPPTRTSRSNRATSFTRI